MILLLRMDEDNGKQSETKENVGLREPSVILQCKVLPPFAISLLKKW